MIRYVANGNNCVIWRDLYEGTANSSLGGTLRRRTWADLGGPVACNGLTQTGDVTTTWNPGCYADEGGYGWPFTATTPIFGWRRYTCSESSASLYSPANGNDPAYQATMTIDVRFDGLQAGCVQPTCKPCCLPDQTCVLADPVQCAAFGGFPAANCADCLTRQPGACCDPITGACSMKSREQCDLIFGTFLGPGIPCASVNCPQPPTGACCLGGTCTQTTNAACIGVGGIYQGNNVLCANVNCAQVQGGCCYPEGGCLITPGRTVCEQTGGQYLGDGTDCTGNPCGVGACCLPSGTCQQYTPQGCSQNSGTFLGVGLPCEGAVCTGCCCRNPPGLSGQTSAAECFQLGGTFHGIGTVCVVNPEPRPGGDTTGQIDCSNPPPPPVNPIRIATGAETMRYGSGGGCGGCRDGGL